MISLPIL